MHSLTGRSIKFGMLSLQLINIVSGEAILSKTEIINKKEFERLMYMTKITFKQQVFIGIILIVAGNVLALILHEGLFANIAWILYGLILILHPVYPEKYGNDVKKAILGSRLAGVICILVGIFTRFIP